MASPASEKPKTTGNISSLTPLKAASNGRGRGMARGFGRGYGRGQWKPSAQAPVKVNIPRPAGQVSRPATQIILKQSSVEKQQFEDSEKDVTRKDTVTTAPKKTGITILKKSPVVTARPYLMMINSFVQAVSHHQPDRAIKLAACLSYPVPETRQDISEADRKILKEGYQTLAQSLHPEKTDQQQALLQALSTTLVSSLCKTTTQTRDNQSDIDNACTLLNLSPMFDQVINGIDTQHQVGGAAKAMHQVQVTYHTYRLLLNEQQLKRLRTLFIKLCPQLFAEAEKLAKNNAMEAVSFLRWNFFPYVELLDPCATDKQKPLPIHLRKQLHRLLCRYLASDTCQHLPASNAVYLHFLVRYLENYGCLERGDANDLHTRTTVKADAATKKNGSSPETEITQQLLKGNSEQALQLCMETYSHKPDIWNGTQAIALNHRLKCALKAELSSLCFEAGTSDKLTLEHCERLNDIFVRLLGTQQVSISQEYLWNLPWLTGRINCCMLFTLRYLFTINILQPRWDKVIACGCTQTTIDELLSLIKRFGMLLNSAHTQEFEQLQQECHKKNQQEPSQKAAVSAQQKPTSPVVRDQDKATPAQNPPVNTPPIETMTAKTMPTETPATAKTVSIEQAPLRPVKDVTTAEADDEDVVEDVVKNKPLPLEVHHGRTRPSEKQFPFINIEELESMMASVEKAKAFKERVTRARLDNYPQALEWMDLLQEYLRTHPRPRSRTEGKNALMFVITGVLLVITNNAFYRIKACNNDPDQLRIVCKDIADYLAEHVYPLHDLTYDYCQSSYIHLVKVVYEIYLEPLKRAIIINGPKDMSGDRNLLWQNCCDMYPYMMLYLRDSQRCMREVYTRYFSPEIDTARRHLTSREDEVFLKGLSMLNDVVFEGHNFFSWEKTERSCNMAAKAVEAAQQGLKERVRMNPAQWQKVQDDFESKYRKARFLNIPNRELEYYPPDIQIHPEEGPYITAQRRGYATRHKGLKHQDKFRKR